MKQNNTPPYGEGQTDWHEWDEDTSCIKEEWITDYAPLDIDSGLIHLHVIDAQLTRTLLPYPYKVARLRDDGFTRTPMGYIPANYQYVGVDDPEDYEDDDEGYSFV